MIVHEFDLRRGFPPEFCFRPSVVRIDICRKGFRRFVSVVGVPFEVVTDIGVGGVPFSVSFYLLVDCPDDTKQELLDTLVGGFVPVPVTLPRIRPRRSG